MLATTPLGGVGREVQGALLGPSQLDPSCSSRLAETTPLGGVGREVQEILLGQEALARQAAMCMRESGQAAMRVCVCACAR
jgi:hypothetical protein